MQNPGQQGMPQQSPQLMAMIRMLMANAGGAQTPMQENPELIRRQQQMQAIRQMLMQQAQQQGQGQMPQQGGMPPQMPQQGMPQY